MLKSISIKNFAIIEDLDISFEHGMTILTGETGAGKSILIDALSLLVGERSDFDKIRSGASKAIIEGEFIINTPYLINLFKENYGDDLIEDNRVIVTRTLDISLRSTVRVNGLIFPLSKLKSMMSYLIDIHSQHQNLFILDEKNHLSLIDEYLGDNDQKNIYLNAYNQYIIAKKALKELENQRIDESEALIIADQIKELESANIEVGEIASLEEEKERLMSSRKISEAINNFLILVDDDNGVLSKLYLAKKELDRSNDEKIIEYGEKISSIYYELKDITNDLGYELEELSNVTYRLEEIDDRLYLLKRLIRKYRADEEDLLKLLTNLQEKLYLIDHFERIYLEKEKEVTELYNIAYKEAVKLSSLRKEASKKLSQEIDTQLNDLSLIYASFSVNFEVLEQFNKDGIDNIKFLLTTNKGMKAASLKSVASGGETSRIMLALKTIFGRLSHMETIIFDEIDTGVSGKVAMQIARKMKEISENIQVITISHLPQVASIASYHYLVSKYIEDNITKSKVTVLDNDQRIIEIGKLLSGENVSNASLEAAKELIKEANK